MSLCIAMNNPFSKFVVISGDGRITKGGKLVRDNHKKLTILTKHISMFCSGAQDYCEELRSIVEAQVNQQTSISELGLIVQMASIEVQKCFEEDYPEYLEEMPGFGALATVIAYYDTATNESGSLEFCISDGFMPNDSRDSFLKVRGLEREKVLEYLGSQIDPERIIEIVFSTFKHINSVNDDVGGTVILHVISPKGIDAYEWRDYE